LSDANVPLWEYADIPWLTRGAYMVENIRGLPCDKEEEGARLQINQLGDSVCPMKVVTFPKRRFDSSNSESGTGAGAATILIV
jgi:hypothetical protein